MFHRISVIAVAAMALISSDPGLAGEVEITLTNVRPDAGDLYVGLQREDQFMQNTGISGEIVENPQEGTVTVTLPNVPDGRYAFTAWHDIDGDGKFSMGPRGPVDGWAMVGATELRGMPSFDMQSFTVEGERTTVREPMLYGARRQ